MRGQSRTSVTSAAVQRPCPPGRSTAIQRPTKPNGVLARTAPVWGLATSSSGEGERPPPEYCRAAAPGDRCQEGRDPEQAVPPAERRAAARQLVAAQVKLERACLLVGIPRPTWYDRLRRHLDVPKGRQLYLQRTQAMKIGLTNRVWTLRAWLLRPQGVACRNWGHARVGTVFPAKEFPSSFSRVTHGRAPA